MPELPLTSSLDGWTLFRADLERGDGDQDLGPLRREVTDTVRGRFDLGALATHPTVAALRRLFRAAGTDPTRYRPSSEALLRRLLKGNDLPAIDPIVDVNNCLSVLLAAPCCVMAEGTFAAPFALRSGTAGESYESLRGPFNLEGRPLLVDAHGPCDSPITGSQRVKVTPGTQRCTLIAYLPAGEVAIDAADAALDGILTRTGAVRRGG